MKSKMERVIGEFKNDGLLHLQFWEDEYNHNISDFAVPEVDAKTLYYELRDYFKQHVETAIHKKEDKAKEYRLKAVLNTERYLEGGSNIEKAYIAGWDTAIENQSKSFKWIKNSVNDKPQLRHSVLMKTTHGIAEGEWNGKEWIQYRWSSKIKDSDVLYWMELYELELPEDSVRKQVAEVKEALYSAPCQGWREDDENHFNNIITWLISLKQRLEGK